MSIQFCNQCGHEVVHRIPEGDDKPRAICTQCFHIQYENPKIVNACIIEHQGKILLGKRTIQPRAGFWNVPAGFMENGEATRSGAIREVKEELLADLKNVTLFGVYNIIQRNQVHVYFRGELAHDHFGPGAETSDVRLFTPADIPWDELAFPVGITALQRYVKEMKTGDFSIKEEDIIIDYDLLKQINQDMQ
ncbi:NUDIX hydrolase [Marinicella meishanensis]|uniref:NUDIX hydrolase n=1 Tax=Marinicella meishanensis TaxID=2873263 RepID=UPI001CBBDF09|nr:NUDIX hydrolase [Marinicella sp. NBU2979]